MPRALLRRTDAYDGDFELRAERFMAAHRVPGPLARAEAIVAARKDWTDNIEPWRFT